MPDMASDFPSTNYSVPCLAQCFDAMSGVKKLMKVHAVSDYHTLACHPSNEASNQFSPVIQVQKSAAKNIVWVQWLCTYHPSSQLGCWLPVTHEEAMQMKI